MTREALRHGLTGFTHLFNAMSQMTAREPGAVGAALEDTASWCGIIVDGVHVDPVVLKLAMRLRPLDRFVLATDAMPCVGTAETSFMLQGKRILVRDGACFAEDGTLAGSSLDMAGAVRNAVRLLGLDLADASRMASGNPADFLGIGHERGRIAPGLAADLVLLDDDLSVLDTWIGGLDVAQSEAAAAPPAGSRTHALAPAGRAAGRLAILALGALLTFGGGSASAGPASVDVIPAPLSVEGVPGARPVIVDDGAAIVVPPHDAGALADRPQPERSGAEDARAQGCAFASARRWPAQAKRKSSWSRRHGPR